MIRRCTYPSMEDYPRYGGRGIRVCYEWRHSFERFLADLGPAPSETHTLDRKDSDGNYEPGNARWATTTEQHRNKRNTRLITHNGKSQIAGDWARELGINRQTILERIRRGWSIERALSK